MYRAALPPHWILAQMMNHNNNVQPHSVAAYYTGCTELVPFLTAQGLLSPSNLDIVQIERSLKSSHWTDSRKCKSPPPNKFSHEDSTPSSGSVITMAKGIKRQLDVGGTPRIPQQNSGKMNLKRGPPSGRSSPVEGSNGSRHSPPPKRPLLMTPPLCAQNHNPPDLLHDNEYDQNSISCRSPPPKKRSLLMTPSPSNAQNTNPPDLLHDNEYDQLSQSIWETFINYQQTEELYASKMRLRDVLYRLLQEAYPYCGLYVVGSSMNGFGINTSDMDMCLMLTHNEIDQRNEATTILRHIMKAMRKYSYIQTPQLIKAKVPILKFTDAVSKVEVDLNINNSVGIRNTHLLNCYAKMDWRVRPLIVIIKMWAKEKDINDAKSMTISSYSLVLMVIHFLQCGTSVPVLPSLQKLYPHKFSPSIDIRSLILNEELPPYHSPNRESLGELFLGFLDYYSNFFDFSSEAISIRMGSKLSKHIAQNQRSRKNNPGQWKCLCIEEPFDLTNTARSVYSEEVFERVKMVFRTSWNRLRETKKLNSVLKEWS